MSTWERYEAEKEKGRGKKRKGIVAAALVALVLLSITALEVIGPSPLFDALKPTPTPKPTKPPISDYSGYFNDQVPLIKNWAILTPFAKTINEYGNDVYVGTTKNTTGGYTKTESIEITKSQNESKDHFAKSINSKLNQGYSSYDPTTYGISLKGKWCTAGLVSEE